MVNYVPLFLDGRRKELETMSKKLLIVESPAKAVTIGKYLGGDFTKQQLLSLFLCVTSFPRGSSDKILSCTTKNDVSCKVMKTKQFNTSEKKKVGGIYQKIYANKHLRK